MRCYQHLFYCESEAFVHNPDQAAEPPAQEGCALVILGSLHCNVSKKIWMKKLAAMRPHRCQSERSIPDAQVRNGLGDLGIGFGQFCGPLLGEFADFHDDLCQSLEGGIASDDHSSL